MRKHCIPASHGPVLAAGIFVPAHGAGAEPLPAPYQAEGIAQYRNDLGSGDGGRGLDAPQAAASRVPLFRQGGAWQARFRPRGCALLCRAGMS